MHRRAAMTPMQAGQEYAHHPLIAKLECLAPLTRDDRARLYGVSTEIRYVPQGTDLMHQGDPPGDVFLVLKGFACRYKLRRTGVRQIMAYLVPGDLSDIDAPVLARADHAVGTLSNCSVARIATEVFEGLMSSPTLARALRMSALVDGAAAREWLVNVGRRSAPERLAHLFCELFVRMHAAGQVGDDGYAFPLTQVDLADTTGLTPVHVNRTLKDLRLRGLIELRGRRLTIRDLPRLLALAEFDPAYLHFDERAIAWTTAWPSSKPAPPVPTLRQAKNIA